MKKSKRKSENILRQKKIEKTAFQNPCEQQKHFQVVSR